MSFLLWTLGIILAINLTIRLFGKRILTFGMKRVMRKLMKDAEKQAQAYQKNYDQGDFRQNVYVDNEVKVSAPKYDDKKDIRVEEIAEEIEYEEI
ncbi:MAG: hypothetical protein R8P61_20380 [Bacteroidia bacterium]|nr:hypothetical protein [Bacteroidia bacterium]